MIKVVTRLSNEIKVNVGGMKNLNQRALNHCNYKYKRDALTKQEPGKVSGDLPNLISTYIVLCIANTILAVKITTSIVYGFF